MYKLLIVDDNDTHVKCVLDYVNWEELNFSQIKIASNGADAFEIFKSFRPDLVITDVVMPVCDGLTLVNKIRELDSRVHIIFMSCHEDFNYIKKALDHSITAYILKPLNPKILKENVMKMLTDMEAREKAAKTSQILSDFLPYVRESLLYRLLYSEHYNLSDNILREAQFGDFRHAVIVKYLFLNKTDNCILLYELQNAVKQAFPSFSVNSITEVPNKLIILLMSDEVDEESFLTGVLASIHEHIKTLHKQYSLSVAVGISNVFTNLKDAGIMLRQAAAALESTYSPEADEIYFFENFEEVDEIDIAYNITNLKQDLSQLLDKADHEAIDEFLLKYFSPNIIMKKNAAKALCFSTVTTLQLLFAERNADINDLFETPNIIWAKLNEYETIADTYQWMKNILVACCEFVTTDEKNNHNSIVTHIKEYIETNYKDITSVEQVASVLFISAGYAKNIFKKHTGQTIFDYLVETRIKEAKRLLSSSSYMVYEVSEMVGYVSKAHFTETFKRKTGMTPKEYQLKRKK